MILVAVLVGRGVVRAEASRADPIRLESIVRTDPPQRLFVARVDLTDPRVSLAVVRGGPDPDGPGPWETVLRRPSALAKDNGFALAINTVFFAHQSTDGDIKKYATGDPASSLNLVVIDGRPATANLTGAALWFDQNRHASIGLVNGHTPPGAWQAAAGSQLVVLDGKNVVGPGDTTRHPRTGAGLTADGKTLILLVADGRRPGWASGITMAELGDEMIALGCANALNFDGGGSSTMVAAAPDGRPRVVNTPSDGSTFLIPLSIERPVPYVLGVKLAAEASTAGHTGR